MTQHLTSPASNAKINSLITPIIERALWRGKLRTNDQIAAATGYSSEMVHDIRTTPATIPGDVLANFVRCLDEQALKEMLFIYYEIQRLKTAGHL